MKRGYKLLFALAAMMLMMLLSSTALADTMRFGTVNVSSVNLRENPSTQSRKLGVYEKGTWLRIDGQSGNFYKVSGPDGKSGYMVKDYVYISAAAKGVIGIVDVNGDLNMRSSGSYSGRVIAASLCQLEEIERVQILVDGAVPEEYDSSWFGILLPNSGWFL